MEDGDGCSHTCTVEFGFKCDDAEPSNCNESIQPTGEIAEVTPENVVILYFSEEI